MDVLERMIKLSHIHEVNDSDNKFIVDGISRVIKVTKTIEDINNGFKGAYVTLELDLTDVTEGALVFESCKCCTTILDLWIE